MVRNSFLVCAKALLIAIIINFLLGCSEVNYVIHADTDRLRSGVTEKDFEKYKKFVTDGILMVPDFTMLSDSYDPPASSIRFYSHTKSGIFIDRVEISGSNVSFVKSINRNIEISQKLGSVYYHITPLFSDEDISEVDIERIWDNESLKLKIFYSHSSEGSLNLIIFELKLKSRKDISWPT